MLISLSIIGKTYLYNMLAEYYCSYSLIILYITSIGVALLLLPSSYIAYKYFWVPILYNKDLTCNIKQGISIIELI